jgi:hypothetical protein
VIVVSQRCVITDVSDSFERAAMRTKKFMLIMKFLQIIFSLQKIENGEQEMSQRD